MNRVLDGGSRRLGGERDHLGQLRARRWASRNLASTLWIGSQRPNQIGDPTVCGSGAATS